MKELFAVLLVLVLTGSGKTEDKPATNEDRFAALVAEALKIEEACCKMEILTVIPVLRAKFGDFEGAFRIAESCFGAAPYPEEVFTLVERMEAIRHELKVTESTIKGLQYLVGRRPIAKRQIIQKDLDQYKTRNVVLRQQLNEILAKLLDGAANVLRDRMMKARVFGKLAMDRIQAGDLEAAKTAITAHEQAAAKTPQFRERLGHGGGAMLMASLPRAFALAQGKEARHHTEAREFPEAVHAAEKINDAGYKTEILAKIAIAQAGEGDVAGAMNTAERVESDRYKARCLTSIAIAQSKAADINGALKTVALIEEGLKIDETRRLRRRFSPYASAKAQSLVALAIAHHPGESTLTSPDARPAQGEHPIPCLPLRTVYSICGVPSPSSHATDQQTVRC